MPDAEDLIGRPVGSGEAVGHLYRYVDLLLSKGPFDAEGPLAGHIDTTMIDLLALALNAEGDGAELARVRGLKSARAQAIIAEIRARYFEPAFSVRDVARKLRLSPRYVQNLLGETGKSFVERVLELRLQRARSMLADRRRDRMRIGDIADACGFNEVSYFNRSFRRRFGASPREYRNGSGSGP